MKHLLVACCLASLPAFSAQPVALTEEEWKMFRHYQRAMADPQLEKIKPEKRFSAIAKDARFKQKDLERAIARGEAAGDVKAVCEGNLQEKLGATELKPRLGKLEVDTSSPHAVAYVQWSNDDLTLLEEEASLVAAHAAESCPILSSIQVWAQDAKSPKARVFQALISRSAASKIRAERVKDFADTRFIRLFENVKSLANGDDLSQPAEGAGPSGSTGAQ